MRIPFNKPFATGSEFAYIQEAIERGHLSGDGPFTKRIHAWLVEATGAKAALLTHSATAALEMMGLLLDIQPGDEVIMPSFTFVSTANAFVLRGGVPVFVDVRSDTMNIDEKLVEEAITPRTKAVMPVHYAGVACDMDALEAICKRHHVALLEDAAQCIGASYKGRALGSIGELGALSFHETKNVISGEGGALLINDNAFTGRAEAIREKGTNRSQFFRGEIDKYTWVDVGSSFLPSEILAAFLWAQLQQLEPILADRMRMWQRYNDQLAGLEERGILRRPRIPTYAEHNGHIFYVIMRDESLRDAVLAEFRRRGIVVVFHYVPLHSSPAGQRFGRTATTMAVTDHQSALLLRLPLYPHIGTQAVDEVCSVLEETARHLA